MKTRTRNPRLLDYAIRAMRRHNFDPTSSGGGAGPDMRYAIGQYLYAPDGEYLTLVKRGQIGVAIGDEWAIYSCREVKAAADSGLVQVGMFGGAA